MTGFELLNNVNANRASLPFESHSRYVVSPEQKFGFVLLVCAVVADLVIQDQPLPSSLSSPSSSLAKIVEDVFADPNFTNAALPRSLSTSKPRIPFVGFRFVAAASRYASQMLECLVHKSLVAYGKLSDASLQRVLDRLAVSVVDGADDLADFEFLCDSAVALLSLGQSLQNINQDAIQRIRDKCILAAAATKHIARSSHIVRSQVVAD